MSEKEAVVAAIARAQAELVQALGELEKVPAFDPGVVAFSAHALNNYLTVTAGTVELLLLSLADYPDEQVRRFVEGLGHVTELMRHTVSQLVTASGPADAKLRLRKWELRPLVQRACHYYQRLADRKELVIVVEPADEVPPAWTDPVAVAAVLDNLVSNAIKYSEPGKRIWVRLESDATYVVCRVRDEGPGLDPGDQSKLFQRGVRLAPRPTGGEPSSGYGLAVAKSLVEQMGGRLWCESRVGQGSCFSFRVPAYQEQVHGLSLEK